VQPGAVGKAAVKDVADGSPPGLMRTPKQGKQHALVVAGSLAAGCPPLHRRHHRRAMAAGDEQAKPVQTGNTDRPPCWRVEEAGSDTLEPTGFAGANRAQALALGAFGLLQHTLVPHSERLLASSTQAGNLGRGL
jgi:hypothetical protein